MTSKQLNTSGTRNWWVRGGRGWRPPHFLETVAERRGRTDTSGSVLESDGELCDPDFVSRSKRPRRFELFTVEVRTVSATKVLEDGFVAGDHDDGVSSRHRS